MLEAPSPGALFEGFKGTVIAAPSFTAGAPDSLEVQAFTNLGG